MRDLFFRNKRNAAGTRIFHEDNNGCGNTADNCRAQIPALENPLLGQGIVLIDEIDLHLHPQREAEILPKFHATFPNCQFIVSTHSPLVLSQLEADSIFLLSHDEEGKIEFSHPEAANGLTANENES